MLAQELRCCLRRGEADTAEFSRVGEESNLYKAARAAFNFLGRGHFTPLHEHRWLELPESFEEFLQGISRKNRHELRRHEKRLADDFSGNAHIHCYRHEDEVKELAGEVEKISAKTYQRALGVGFQPDVETLEALRVAAHQGGLRGCVLYLDEQPCAYFIGKQYKNTFHGTFMGFDPQFGKYSPGLLVLMHSIEECFDPGYRATQVDLGWGDRQYKRVICNRSRQDGPLYLYAPSWAGLKLNFLRSTASLLDRAARRLLAKSSVLQKLKRFVQEQLQKSVSRTVPIP
jgi:CelD/BcsL family acetyltransferase involved in cellulose biosynthesis